MCYAIPGKVTAIDGKKVTVDYFGEKKKAINEIVDLKVGDYIYAQGGYVIQTDPRAGSGGDPGDLERAFF